MSADFLVPVNTIDVHKLASMITNQSDNVLLIDCRTFPEYNANHILSAVNLSFSKIIKRRLQQDKLSVKELLIHACSCDVDEKLDVIVYDQAAKDPNNLSPESFLVILIKKLQLTFRTVSLLKGGLDEFRNCFPELCEDKPKKCPPLTSLSQPCLPIANQGPTRILPFLYLGSQFDVMNKELMKDFNITYVLNVSTSCPQPEFLAEGHFMRIPVNDNYNEKMLPYFSQAFHFLDKVRESNSCALVHCLAGVSRSATLAVAYVMRYLRLSSDDGYRYVKSKRPSISPNFNFLGQLLEFEKQLRDEHVLEEKPEAGPSPVVCAKKRICRTDMRNLGLSLDLNPQRDTSQSSVHAKKEDQSPTTALAKLSFDVPNQEPKHEEPERFVSDFKPLRSKSCYGDFLRSCNEGGAEKKAKESNVPAKVLSPVKEIKCDALISEISIGHSDLSVKSPKLGRSRNIGQHSSEEKRPNTGQQKHGAHSSKNREKFSLLTLTHLPSPFSKAHRKVDGLPQSKKRSTWSFLSSKHSSSDKKEPKFDHPSEKSDRPNSMVRSNENLPLSADPELKFVSKECSPFHVNPPFVHSLSLNSNLHRLIDTPGASNHPYDNPPYQREVQNENTFDNYAFPSDDLVRRTSSVDRMRLTSIPSDENWIQNSDASVARDDQLEVSGTEALNNNEGKN